MPIHHPDDSLLIDYAAGSLGEAKALLVATHLALCPACRAAVRDGEVVGGTLLDDASFGVAAGDPREPGIAETTTPAETSVPSTSSPLPNPLRDYLGHPVDELRWTPVWRGMREYVLPQFSGGVRLLSIPGGRRMPRHTHHGEELTLVLQGSFADATGRYLKGDVATAGAAIDHRPEAGPAELCLCLAVEDGALKLTGWMGRLLTAAAALQNLMLRKQN